MFPYSKPGENQITLDSIVSQIRRGGGVRKDLKFGMNIVT